MVIFQIQKWSHESTDDHDDVRNAANDDLIPVEIRHSPIDVSFERPISKREKVIGLSLRKHGNVMRKEETSTINITKKRVPKL